MISLSTEIPLLRQHTATQTLGEEYTDIWQYSSVHRQLPPPSRLRLALILLPTVPYYLFSRWGHALRSSSLPAWLNGFITNSQEAMPVVSELNLAMFYVAGVYYDVVKRALGIQYVRRPRCLLALTDTCFSYLRHRRTHIYVLHHTHYWVFCSLSDSCIVWHPQFARSTLRIQIHI